MVVDMPFPGRRRLPCHTPVRRCCLDERGWRSVGIEEILFLITVSLRQSGGRIGCSGAHACLFRVHSVNLRSPSRVTTAATRYQYSRATAILVPLNMPTLPISIPPPMPIPIPSIPSNLHVQNVSSNENESHRSNAESRTQLSSYKQQEGE